MKNQINTKSEKKEDDNIRFGSNGLLHIWHASEKGSLEAVRYFYAQDPTSINKKNEEYFNGTPSHLACKGGHLDIEEFLLSKGADVNLVDKFNVSPLMLAALNGHVSLVKLLLNNGANINHQDFNNATALHWAAGSCHIEIVNLLVENGADYNLKNKWKNTPLAVVKFKSFKNPAKNEKIKFARATIIKYLSSLKRK